MHDLGKGTTPRELLPRHHGHEQRGLGPLRELCARIKVPNAYRKLAEKVMLHHGTCHRVFELRSATLVDLLQRLEAFHRGDQTEDFLLACEADARGRTGYEDRPYPQADWIRAARTAARGVKTQALMERGLIGEAFGQALRELRIQAVRSARQDFQRAAT
jgi:tRNA nucleotidyltransferase (CCA-adding enzyme)